MKGEVPLYRVKGLTGEDQVIKTLVDLILTAEDHI